MLLVAELGQGLMGAIAPSETCLAPAQPHQGFPNDCPVFNCIVTPINIKKCLVCGQTVAYKQLIIWGRGQAIQASTVQSLSKTVKVNLL